MAYARLAASSCRLPWAAAIILSTFPAFLAWPQQESRALPRLEWATTMVKGTDGAAYAAVAVDADGDVYAAGWLTGTKPYDFGARVTATGTVAEPNIDPSHYFNSGSVLLVKYDPHGSAMWARTLKGGRAGANFTGVAVDPGGNAVAVGWAKGNDVYDFGDGVTADNPGAADRSPLIVEYDSGGRALWSHAALATRGGEFDAVAVGSDGSIYAAGRVDGAGSVDLGNNVRFVAEGAQSILARFDKDGKAQWVVSPGPDSRELRGVALDKARNIYAAGQRGNQALLVKYDPSGALQWTRTIVSGQYESLYSAVAVDDSGAIYTSGECRGDQPFDFGNGVQAKGVARVGERNSALANFLLVKYDQRGRPWWARTMVDGEAATFSGVAAGRGGGVYACGILYDALDYGFGDGVVVKGSAIGHEGLVLVRYDAAGTPRWAWPMQSSTGNRGSYWYAVTTDAAGGIYCGGRIDQSGSYSLGPGVALQGPVAAGDGANVLVAKYTDAAAGGAASPFADSQGIVNDSRVRLRAAPNLQAATLSYLSKGDKVDVMNMSTTTQRIGTADDFWYQVRTSDGKEGWTYGAFLTLSR
jgi:hypothetical protein